MSVTNISSESSNQGGSNGMIHFQKEQDKKVSWIIFHSRWLFKIIIIKSGNMNQTAINNAYQKKHKRKKEPTLHEVRVINLKKGLTLTKDLKKDQMME